MIRTVLLVTAFAVPAAGLGQSQTNTITVIPNGITYAFLTNGNSAVLNPTINLKAGVNNYFVINDATIHPVVISTTNNNPAAQYSGASPQNTYNSTITLSTPSSGFPTTLYYICSVHRFFGQINLTSIIGATPPPNTILSLQIGTNIVMLSSGTNTTWTLVPEFRSNVTTAVWTPVSNYTNTFNNGTNRTVFNRLDPICGPNVYLRLRQQPN